MFVCKECGEARGVDPYWFTVSIGRSYGPCELCRRIADCIDCHERLEEKSAEDNSEDNQLKRYAVKVQVSGVISLDLYAVDAEMARERAKRTNPNFYRHCIAFDNETPLIASVKEKK